MSIPGFDAAQARYDAMLPAECPPFTCKHSGESWEDCEQDDHFDCEPEDDDRDDEPDDLDDYRHGTGRYAPDYWLD